MDFRYIKQACSSISEEELTLFQDYLREQSGISISSEKAYVFETRLSKMLIDAGVNSFREFYDYIRSGADPLITQKIINAMATNETLWFRDAAPWKWLEETALPRLVKALQSGERTRVRIWCAAVSTGQEAYSTAMCVEDYLTKNNIEGVSLSDFTFIATDISTNVLEIAKKGRYDAISMRRGLSDYYRSKYFVQENAAWNLDPKIRDAVRFSHFNLLDDYQHLGFFDVIFCRYVLIYFSQELQQEIVAKIHEVLTDGGAFFTGTYTFFDLMDHYFDINHYQSLTYYTKKAVKK